MAKPKKPVLCTNCGGEVATVPAPAKPRGESRTIRVALYAGYRQLGYLPCPTCKDYVDPATHDCATYETIWVVTRSMDQFARAMQAIWAMPIYEKDAADGCELMARAGAAPLEIAEAA